MSTVEKPEDEDYNSEDNCTFTVTSSQRNFTESSSFCWTDVV